MFAKVYYEKGLGWRGFGTSRQKLQLFGDKPGTSRHKTQVFGGKLGTSRDKHKYLGVYWIFVCVKHVFGG